MKRTFSLFLAAVIIIAVIIGLVKRSTYTDITREPEYLNHFSVAELPENFAVENAALLPTELKNAPIVLQVAPVGGIEAVFKTLRQPVEIVHILKGSDLIDETIGEQIYITRASWCLFFDDMTANLGFVNTMRHGQYYLIFLEGKVELPEAQKSPTNIYYLCNTIVTPVSPFRRRSHIRPDTSRSHSSPQSPARHQSLCRQRKQLWAGSLPGQGCRQPTLFF